MLQQTTSAQISPIIRGFTGQSNVYLVDGVRFNVGQWRSGPTQYMAWIDGGPVDTIEVVRGGGSVQYGSDALGGTIQFLTTPTLFSPRAARVSGNVELSARLGQRRASAAKEISGFRRAARRFDSAPRACTRATCAAATGSIRIPR